MIRIKVGKEMGGQVVMRQFILTPGHVGIRVIKHRTSAIRSFSPFEKSKSIVNAKEPHVTFTVADDCDCYYGLLSYSSSRAARLGSPLDLKASSSKAFQRFFFYDRRTADDGNEELTKQR